MKEIVYTEYGGPDVLHLKEVEKPLEKTAEAHRYIETGIKKGHVVVTV